jgi:hypothetical protein
MPKYTIKEQWNGREIYSFEREVTSSSSLREYISGWIDRWKLTAKRHKYSLNTTTDYKSYAVADCGKIKSKLIIIKAERL